MKFNSRSISYTVNKDESWKGFVFHIEKGSKAGNLHIKNTKGSVSKILDTNPYKLTSPKIKVEEFEILESIERTGNYSYKKQHSHSEKIKSKHGKILILKINLSLASFPEYRTGVFFKTKYFYLLDNRGIKLTSFGASLVKNKMNADYSIKVTGGNKGFEKSVYVAFEIGNLKKEDLKELKLYFLNSNCPIL